KFLNAKSVEPAEVNNMLVSVGSAPISEKTKAGNLLRRPNIEIEHISKAVPAVAEKLESFNQESIEQAIIAVKYESYIEKENQHAAKMGELENYRIKERLDYRSIPALSAEAREKLLKVDPETIGQASRISGV